MKKLKFIPDLIKELSCVNDSILEKAEIDVKSEGYNCAVSCIKNSIQTRVEYLKEMTGEEVF